MSDFEPFDWVVFALLNVDGWTKWRLSLLRIYINTIAPKKNQTKKLKNKWIRIQNFISFVHLYIKYITLEK